MKPTAHRRARRATSLAALAVLASFASVASLAAAAAAAPSPYTALTAKAEALVQARYVLNVKMEGAPADREIEGETSCLMIDPKGVAVCSNVELGGYVSLVGRMMGNAGLSGSPTNLEVTVGSTDYPAALLARDSDRDLAWIRLQKTAGATFVHLDLAASARLAPGDRFYAVRRLHDFFGRAPLVTEGTVAAVLARPRELLMPQSALGGGFGVPVFAADGAFVGLTVLQMPGEDDASPDLFNNPLSFLGQSTRLQDMISGLVLPAAEVLKATELARETFPEETAEPAASPADGG